MKLVFTTKWEIVNLMISDSKSEGVKMCNLSSPIDGAGDRLDKLIPPLDIIQRSQYDDEKMFDMWYADYILNNQKVFDQMFFGIMYNLYEGLDVCVFISEDTELCRIITDSLMKFIQQRYGWNGNIVRTPEDYEVSKDSDFTLNGIRVFDEDKLRAMNSVDTSFL